MTGASGSASRFGGNDDGGGVYEYSLADDDNGNDISKDSSVDNDTPQKRRSPRKGGSVASSPSTTGGYYSDGSEDTFDALSATLEQHKRQQHGSPKLNPSISRFSDFKLRTRLWDAYRLARVILGTQPLPMNGKSSDHGSVAPNSPDGKDAMPNLKKGTILHAIRVVAEMKLQIVSLQQSLAYAEKAAESVPDIGPLVVVNGADDDTPKVRHRGTIGIDQAQRIGDISTIPGAPLTSSGSDDEGHANVEYRVDDEKKHEEIDIETIPMSNDVSKLQSELKASRQQYKELHHTFSWLLNQTTTKLQNLEEKVNADAPSEDVRPSIDEMLQSIAKASAVPHIHAAQARADKKLSLERLFHQGQVTQLEQQLADSYLQLDGLSHQAHQQGKELQKSARKLVRAERKLSATTEQLASSASAVEGLDGAVVAAAAAGGAILGSAASLSESQSNETHHDHKTDSGDGETRLVDDLGGSFQSAIQPLQPRPANSEVDDANLTPHQREIREYQRRIADLEHRLIAADENSESTNDSGRPVFERTKSSALVDHLAAIPEMDTNDESEVETLTDGLSIDDEFVHLQLQLEILKSETSIPRDRLLLQQRTAARQRELDMLDRQLDIMAKNAVFVENHETSTSEQLKQVQDRIRSIREQQERFLAEIEAKEAEEQDDPASSFETNESASIGDDEPKPANIEAPPASGPPKIVSAPKRIKTTPGPSPNGSDSSQDGTETTHACVSVNSTP